MQVEMNWSRVIIGVDNGNVAVISYFSNNFTVDTLTLADFLKVLKIVTSYKQPVTFLIFSTPDLKDGHRLVPEYDLANINLTASSFHQFREDIAWAAGTLIVDTLDGIF